METNMKSFREGLTFNIPQRMDFVNWEQIFHGEFDGRRAKRVLVKIIGE